MKWKKLKSWPQLRGLALTHGLYRLCAMRLSGKLHLNRRNEKHLSFSKFVLLPTKTEHLKNSKLSLWAEALPAQLRHTVRATHEAGSAIPSAYPELFAFLATQAALARATARLCGLLLLAIFLAMPAHPATAADATSFDPTLVAVKPRLIPVGTIIPWISLSAPEDAWAWLDCDGSSFSASQYPDLAKLYPGVLPDLRDEFLRGGTLAQIGQKTQDSIKSHLHSVPPHSHTVSGTASAQNVSVGGQSVSGTAAGQQYLWDHTWLAQYISEPGYGGGAFPVPISTEGTTLEYMGSYSEVRTATSSTVTGVTSSNTFTTTGGSITGITNTVGQNTNSTGESETAPKHIRVRYLIRALP